jgi:erythromycin esterase
MSNQVNWLRATNAEKGKPVRVYGLDLPASCGSIVPAVDAIAAYLNGIDPNSADRIYRLDRLARSYGDPVPETDAERRTALKAYSDLPASDRNELSSLLADLTARFDALRLTYISRSDRESYDLARQHLRMAVKLDAFIRDSLRADKHLITDASIRDSAMAEAVEWILEREARILILAHNVHVQRSSYRIPWLERPGKPMPLTPMGRYLADLLGSDYFVIGTTFGSGETISVEPADGSDSCETSYVVVEAPAVGEDTVDGLLAATWQRPVVVDLRGLSTRETEWISGATWMRCLDQRIEVSVEEAFDLLVHIPSVSVWKSLATPWSSLGASPMQPFRRGSRQ